MTDYKNIKCKICGGDTSIWGCVDFNKNCEERNGTYLDYTGNAIYYLECNSCHYLFSPDFDTWTKEDFKQRIYNEEYIKVDPEYSGTRSINDAKWFMQNVNIDKNFDILDYGAGPAVLAKELNKHGYKVDSWDPMWGTDPDFPPDKKFDMVMAFEVMEHTPTPVETIKEMAKWLKPTGMILICTLNTGIMEKKRDSTFWYLSPRNGHLAMFSNKSIEELFKHVGMKVQCYPWSVSLATF